MSTITEPLADGRYNYGGEEVTVANGMAHLGQSTIPATAFVGMQEQAISRIEGVAPESTLGQFTESLSPGQRVVRSDGRLAIVVRIEGNRAECVTANGAIFPVGLEEIEPTSEHLSRDDQTLFQMANRIIDMQETVRRVGRERLDIYVALESMEHGHRQAVNEAFGLAGLDPIRTTTDCEFTFTVSIEQEVDVEGPYIDNAIAYGETTVEAYFTYQFTVTLEVESSDADPCESTEAYDAIGEWLDGEGYSWADLDIEEATCEECQR